MKKVSISLIALLAIVISVASAFKTAPKAFSLIDEKWYSITDGTSSPSHVQYEASVAYDAEIDVLNAGDCIADNAQFVCYAQYESTGDTFENVALNGPFQED
jgi:hypothetical protein